MVVLGVKKTDGVDEEKGLALEQWWKERDGGGDEMKLMVAEIGIAAVQEGG